LLNFIFRERKIIRWNESDLLKKYKILPGNLKIKLNEALQYQTFVKLDVIAFINNKFIELTNFFILMYEKDGILHPINLSYNFYDDNEKIKIYEKQITEDIEKLYFSDMYFNPFKAAKR